MHHGAYQELRRRLRAAIIDVHVDGQGVRIHAAIEHHMDNLVLYQSSIESVGHLFVSRFVAECPSLYEPCSLGIVRLGQEGFKWCMDYEDWTSAAWLACMSGLDISLNETIHPHPALLHAMVCNDSMDWPVVYTQALANDALVQQALACDHGLHPQELNEESLSKLSNVYARQIRKGCFMGSGTSLCVLLVVSTWLNLHDKDELPKGMMLRHAHPDARLLTGALQNQWCVDQFWFTGDIAHLEAISLLDALPHQAWFWFLSARCYAAKDPALHSKITRWDGWWSSEHKQFWEEATLWYQLQGAGAAHWNKFDRLLAVKAALDFQAQPRQELCALPEEYLELPPVGV